MMSDSHLLPESKSHNPNGGVIRGKSGGLKPDRSRRSWSPREEEVLILALKDLVTNRWKADNGFRAGFLTRVEEFVRREIPTTTVRAQPHISSKINTWKKFYNSLNMMLDRSGVGFNSDGDWKIECNDDQWAQIVKADSNARYMRYKSWPFYNDWKYIYGKDRAAGLRCEGMTQAFAKMGAAPSPSGGVSSPTGGVPSPMREPHPDVYNINLEDLYTQEEIQESLNPDTGCESSYKSHTASNKPNRKRKAGSALESILEAMSKMNEDTNQRLDTLTTRIGYEFDLSAKRTEVSTLLRTVPGLDRKQKFLASDILVKEPERLDLFMGYDDDEKADYLMHILEEKNGK
ncbi:hypothetical protein SASPL_111083 [Salvia splendens]|uniref:Myb/SANT-like domain-containing protein n=1 Tax=Salvia splendens TaxID=180675 RepID=A0A8X8Y6M0_SALSN|nr:hypothetical protein SASPL_111083 [Salvia splendens]